MDALKVLEMDTLEVLEKMYELLKDENHWCKNWYAQNLVRDWVDAEADDAVRWCIAGAHTRVTSISYETDSLRLIKQVVFPGREDGDITQFNDTTTHAELLQALTDAMNLYKSSSSSIPTSHSSSSSSSISQ